MSHHNVLRGKVFNIYDYISENFYLNRPDIEINGRPFNSTILLSLLTGLNQGKELIIGEPGLGKTTSAEYICALVYRIPLGTIWRAEVSGHPEQTEEKIIGRPDLGKLNQGQEVVLWSYFTLLPTKIVDELNRLPETKQSMILDGVDRGKWEYLNDAIINPEFCFFATANYADQGTHTIVAPLIDRFEILVESKHPGANLAYRVGTQTTDGMILRSQTLEKEFDQVLSSKHPFEDRIQQLEQLCDHFGQKISNDLGLQTLSRSERQEIRSRTNLISFNLDANAFLRLVISELSFCQRYGQKRSHESCDEGCHFTGYLCNAIKNCVSNRFSISAQRYAQSLAWILGDPEVNMEHLRVILPHALAHRIQWQDKTLAQWDNDVRSDPLSIYMAKKAVNEMQRRYLEQGHRVKEALAVAYRISEGEVLEPIMGDHPIYWDIRKDLGKSYSSTS